MAGRTPAPAGAERAAALRNYSVPFRRRQGAEPPWERVGKGCPKLAKVDTGKGWVSPDQAYRRLADRTRAHASMEAPRIRLRKTAGVTFLGYGHGHCCPTVA